MNNKRSFINQFLSVSSKQDLIDIGLIFLWIAIWLIYRSVSK